MRFQNYSRSELIAIHISLSLIVLGLLGETTPGALGFAELLQLGFVAFSFFTIRRISNVIFYFFAVWALLLIFGLLTSIARQHGLNDIIRDLIPFLFFLIFIPLSLLNRVEVNAICTALLLCGIFLVVRFLLKSDSNILSLFGSTMSDNQYLVQDPAALFAALYSSKKIIDALEQKNMFQCLIYMFFFALCLIGFLFMGVRAGVGISLLYFFTILVSMRAALFIRLLIVMVAFLGLIYNFEIFQALIIKFYVHGFNNKDIEFVAVFSFLSKSYDLSFFGLGFGGKFFNPVYNFEVRFTHNLMTYFYLKLGVLGMLFSLFFLSYLFYGITRICVRVLRNGIGNYERLQFALIFAVLPSILLQPTFKSYSFCILFALLIREIQNVNRSCTY